MRQGGRWWSPRHPWYSSPMNQSFSSVLPVVVLLASSGCATKAVPPASIQWSDTAPVYKPSAELQPVDSTNRGWLKVETDRDRDARSGIVLWLRRPYDIYAPDGQSIRNRVDNKGWGDGESARAVELPTGRYVIASVYGTVYRKLQVEVLPGLTTEVPEAAVAESPPVFSQ
jgi:hypothetical protein